MRVRSLSVLFIAACSAAEITNAPTGGGGDAPTSTTGAEDAGASSHPILVENDASTPPTDASASDAGDGTRSAACARARSAPG